jgi:hypothetical protein
MSFITFRTTAQKIWTTSSILLNVLQQLALFTILAKPPTKFFPSLTKAVMIREAESFASILALKL